MYFILLCGFERLQFGRMGLIIGKCTVTLCRNLHNEELCDVTKYCYGDQVKEGLRAGTYCACVGGEERLL
jgi:hypothetical protein